MNSRNAPTNETALEHDEQPNHIDDAFRALLEGLRTTLPGVQVLFAFLLALPLQSSFSELTSPQRTAYFVAFFASALASVLLIAPSAHQRLRAPNTGVHRRSEGHLAHAVKISIAGTVFFAVALGAAVYLVTSFMLTTTAAMLTTSVVVALAAWTWFYTPLVTFRHRS